MNHLASICNRNTRLRYGAHFPVESWLFKYSIAIYSFYWKQTPTCGRKTKISISFVNCKSLLSPITNESNKKQTIKTQVHSYMCYKTISRTALNDRGWEEVVTYMEQEVSYDPKSLVQNVYVLFENAQLFVWDVRQYRGAAKIIPTYIWTTINRTRFRINSKWLMHVTSPSLRPGQWSTLFSERCGFSLAS